MGSAGSKTSRAAGVATRQYPKRPPPTSEATSRAPAATNAPARPPPVAPSHQPGPTVHPQTKAAERRDEAINLDASDPDFARSLRSIGPVQPNPTLSPTSAFNPDSFSVDPRSRGPNPRKNPAIAVLDARSRLQDEAEKEFMEAGRRGHEGRQYLDVFVLRTILQQRDQVGQKPAEIERELGLKAGVVERLGASGVFGLPTETGRGRREVDIV
ncbi:hypothetical protein K431DRAFT_277533 [Polychaeton citri CBS 116435]|uniref:Helix-turn-helix domain-containing protein n=1 Tax=Polychaeton citri CBS 116435 TaxID=1314669 RepID=A0A9P4PY74_9PEZI|nr:hypothetical protein K431DRAFT_277533 [Polychaeton citri CBS 116435]